MERLSLKKVNFKNTNWTAIQKGYDDYLFIMKNMHIFDDEFKKNSRIFTSLIKV